MNAWDGVVWVLIGLMQSAQQPTIIQVFPMKTTCEDRIAVRSKTTLKNYSNLKCVPSVINPEDFFHALEGQEWRKRPVRSAGTGRP